MIPMFIAKSAIKLLSHYSPITLLAIAGLWIAFNQKRVNQLKQYQKNLQSELQSCQDLMREQGYIILNYQKLQSKIKKQQRQGQKKILPKVVKKEQIKNKIQKDLQHTHTIPPPSWLIKIWEKL